MSGQHTSAAGANSHECNTHRSRAPDLPGINAVRDSLVYIFQAVIHRAGADTGKSGKHEQKHGAPGIRG
jgi:hypothetical protein